MSAPNRRSDFDPAIALSRIGSGKTTEKYLADDVVFTQGDVADAVYRVQKGQVKIAVNSAAGKEAVLAILGPGDFLGEGCLNGHRRRMTGAKTMTDCEIVRVEKSAMIRMLHDDTEFAGLFIAHLLHRNSRAEADLIDQLFNSSEKRLARTLLLLANVRKDGEPDQAIAKISQETLAEMVGTTRARVSHFMNKFRRLGLIDYDGHGLHVHGSLLTMVLRDARKRSKTIGFGQ